MVDNIMLRTLLSKYDSFMILCLVLGQSIGGWDVVKCRFKLRGFSITSHQKSTLNALLNSDFWPDPCFDTSSWNSRHRVAGEMKITTAVTATTSTTMVVLLHYYESPTLLGSGCLRSTSSSIVRSCVLSFYVPSGHFCHDNITRLLTTTDGSIL